MSPTKRRLVIALATLVLVAMVPAAVMAAGGQFTDDDDSIFESHIEWLAAAGVTAGCNPPTNDHFCPDDNVTRGQMAAFMRRFAQYIGAEDGTPAEADHATAADTATDAGTVDGKNAIDFQPTIYDFEGNIDYTLTGPVDEHVLGSVTVDPGDLTCIVGFEGNAISVRASSAATGFSAGESATFYVLDSSGTMIDGTVRWIGEPWGSFGLEWMYYGSGGEETFTLVVDEPGTDTYTVRDAQITAEVIKETNCSFPIIIFPGEPADAGDIQPEGN